MADGPWNDFATLDSQRPAAGPWAAYAQPAANDALTSVDESPAQRSAAWTAQEMRSTDSPLIKYPLVAAGTLSTFAHGAVQQIADFFKTGIKAASGQQPTPEEEISAGLVAAGMTSGGFMKPHVEAIAPALKSFDDGVIAPAATRLDAYARTGDPNGVRLEPPIPEVKPALIRPIEGSPFAGVPRSVAAKTGVPEVDSVLASPVTKSVIDNAVIDRSHDVPYMAGGSNPLNDPTVYIDRHVPKEQTIGGVTFDPAEPWSVHENVEQHTMEILTRNGMTDGEAYRVAHFEFAEPAEQAWYRAHGIDQMAAEKEQASWLPRIQHENPENPPPNLYDKPYPHDHVQGAEHEAVTESPPTADEKARALDIIRNAPELRPKSAAPMLAEARELGVIGMDAPENINLVELAKRDAATPAEQAFDAVPPRSLSAAVTPEAMRGTISPREPLAQYEARFKDWISKIDAPGDVSDVIERAARENDLFPMAREGEVPASHVSAVAEAAGLDPKDIDRAGLATRFDSDAKVRAVVQALRHTTRDFMEASKKAAAEPTEENAAAALEAQERQKYVTEYTLGFRAESGRTLNAWKDLLRETERARAAPKIKADEDIGKAPTGATDLVNAVGELHNNIKKPDGPVGLDKVIKAATDLVDAQDKAPEIRKKLVDVAKRVRSVAKEAETTGQTPKGLASLIAEAEELAKEPGIPKEVSGPNPQGLAQMVAEARRASNNPGLGGLPILVKLAEQAERLADTMPRSAEEATAKLPADLASLITTARQTLTNLKRGVAPTGTAFDKLIEQVDQQTRNILKQKTVKKPTDALPPEWQALVDKADFVTKRFGGIAKGEEAAMLLARAGRTAAEQAELARGVEGLTPNQVARVLERLRKNQDPHWLFWSIQQGLISGLITHTKYAFVNTAQTFLDRVIAPEIAAVMGKLRGQDTSLLAPIRAVPAMFGSIPDAIAGVRQAFKTGQRVPLESELRLAARGEANPEAAGAQVPYGQQANKVNFGIWKRVASEAALDKAARIIGIPGRSANSIHTFFKIMNERASLGSRAWEMASKEEKPGTDQFWDRYQHHLDNPTDANLRGAVEDGYAGTFMEKLGEQTEKTARLIRNTPFKWLVFFTHIPFNMIRAGIKNSPLALLNMLGETKMGSALKGELGPEAQNLAYAHVAVGTAVGGYFIHKALSGEMNGDFPTDQKEKNRWKDLGIQPNTVKMDGQWVSMDRLGPIGMVARLSANYAHIFQHYDPTDDHAMMKATFALALGTAKVLGDDVGFETIRNIVDVMENPREAARFAAWQLSSYAMPISLITQTASAMDPNMRVANSFVDGFKYHLPYVREALPAKRDPIYGEPVPNPGYHSILRSSPINTDPVKNELDRLQYYPTAPERTIGHVKLTDEQYDRYEATAGPLVKQMLNAAISGPRYAQMPDVAKQALLKGIISAGRARARQAMQMAYPQLIQQGIDARRAQITGATP